LLQATTLSELMRDPPWRSPLCRQVMLAVFGMFVLLDVLAAIPIYQNGRAQMFENLRETARGYMTSAIDRRKFPDRETLASVGENLEFATTIRGGVFVDAIGEDVVTFGERPDITWRDATLHGQNWRFRSGARIYDVYLPPETLGISYGVLLRLDATEAHAQHMARLRELLVYGLVMAVGMSMLVGFLIGWLVAVPMQRMQRALYHALHSPDAATDHLVRIKSSTEMGVVGTQMDEFLVAVSSSFEDQRARRAWVFDQAGAALLIYSDDGVLEDANARALTLYGAKTFEELASRDQTKMMRVAGKMRAPEHLFSRGQFEASGDAYVNGRLVPCIISGDTVRGADRMVRCHFVTLTNVTPLVADMRKERQRCELLESELGQARHRVKEYRQLFEACLILMDADAAQPPERKITLMPEEMVNAWYKDNIANMVMERGDMRHTALPPTLGCPQQMRKLFNKALTVVHNRAGDQKDIVIAVTATIKDEAQTEILIRAAKEHEQGPTTLIMPAPDAPILIAGLRRLLPANGGALLRVTDAKDAGLNEVAFLIPLDIETHRRSKEDLKDAPGAPPGDPALGDEPDKAAAQA
jgi:PAS domain-containing protein